MSLGRVGVKWWYVYCFFLHSKKITWWGGYRMGNGLGGGGGRSEKKGLKETVCALSSATGLSKLNSLCLHRRRRTHHLHLTLLTAIAGAFS